MSGQELEWSREVTIPGGVQEMFRKCLGVVLTDVV